jgi:hypothetical protein
MRVRHNLLRTAAAEFSDDEVYRYRLRRSFAGDVLAPPPNPVVFLMLNPSSATALEDDPTIRRCIGFAKAWGHSDLLVGNIFALRSTNPDALSGHTDPIGPENDAVLADLPDCMIVAAWGAHLMAARRSARVRELLGRELHCLGTTNSGAPKHPLYLPAVSTPRLWWSPS